MPLQLTTPANLGTYGTHNQVKIVSFKLDVEAKLIELKVQYGDTVNGVWVSGKAPGWNNDYYHYVVDKPFDYDELGEPVPDSADPQFTDMASSTSAEGGEVYYEEVAALLYQWLIDEGLYDGAIV